MFLRIYCQLPLNKFTEHKYKNWWEFMSLSLQQIAISQTLNVLLFFSLFLGKLMSGESSAHLCLMKHMCFFAVQLHSFSDLKLQIQWTMSNIKRFKVSFSKLQATRLIQKPCLSWVDQMHYFFLKKIQHKSHQKSTIRQIPM